ncbi:MAG TPA: GNAT family N-acetyltransferase [Candidatus Jeotgalibaca merdavium]|uniref:GNAT family N-acetyltransferase n=1 Tax=Candidatus Jeotgalibaca merdavium TaxID=2838627 RepID=A0A9D2KYI1_9LACT|nr:GNAT family N-acetyltransferase [Candidatus Jeotgalibaca merdavium]
MTIRYQDNTPISIDSLTQLYQSVGWRNYYKAPAIMSQLLPGAWHYISAWEEDQLVGLIRTISDGCYILYIQDILVHPDYQRQAIGTSLMKQMLERAKDMQQIILTTDDTERTIQFYQSLGFKTMQDLKCVSFMKV